MLNKAKAKSPFHKSNTFYNFVKSGDDVAELTIYDEIGFGGVTAKDVKAGLATLSAKTINVGINSPGGDVFDGVAIFNLLREHPARIEVTVDGLAASAASVIAMAGDTITVADGAFLMIHNAWALTIGNAEDHEKMIGALRKIDSALLSIYVGRTGGDPHAIQRMMTAETWLTGDEATRLGFADGTSKNKPTSVSAAFDLGVFSNVPDQLRQKPQHKAASNVGLTRKDLERILRNEGCSRSEASIAAGAGLRALKGKASERRNSLRTLRDCIQRSNSRLTP